MILVVKRNLFKNRVLFLEEMKMSLNHDHHRLKFYRSKDMFSNTAMLHAT